jgi:hypothetical protein
MGMHWRAWGLACLLGGWLGAGGLGAEPVAAGERGAPYLPQVGDELRYRVSNGDVAITRVTATRGEGKRTYAQVVQTLLRQGSDPQISRFTIIRTEEGMAIQVDPVAGGLKLSPLVFYLSMVDPADDWVAQTGIYRDVDGKEVGYQLRAEFQALETVTVAAGVFEDCARIGYRSTLSGPAVPGAPHGEATELVFWVKPDLGIVKTRSTKGGRVTETELLSFARPVLAHP